MAQPCDNDNPTRDTRRAQMLLAATIWTGAGIMLFSMGSFWMLSGHVVQVWVAALLMVPCVLVGTAKGHFLLDRVALRSITRIIDRGPCAPIWGFYGLRTWVLVGVMMGSGIGLRLLFNVEHWSFFYLGFLYVAVGTALVFASKRMWQTAFATVSLAV